MSSIREDAMIVIKESIAAVLPETAVAEALKRKIFNKPVVLVAIGKAAWNMAKAATNLLGPKMAKGIVITKYGHSRGPIKNCEIIEAGHPVPDLNSVLGSEKVLEMVSTLAADDQVIFLVSGGGSALFEKPLEGVSLEDIIHLTNQLLGCGADIIEINTVRKHLSAVKGGRFALHCGKTPVYAIVLSDVVGDRLDTIASGPAYPDSSTSAEAFRILEKYNISIGENLAKALENETPKVILNCETHVTGSVTALCGAAAKSTEKLGYSSLVLSTTIDCEASEMGKFLASLAREIKKEGENKFGLKRP